MMDIPDQPFVNIAIYLITDLKASTSGNQHILIIIKHFTDYHEAFPIQYKKVDTIICIFINNCLPVNMCPMYLLSNNGIELKNQLMDDIIKQLGTSYIFSTLNHPQSNRKMDIFHNYLKPTLKRLCEDDLDNWNQYLNQVLGSYYMTLQLAIVQTPFFLVCGR